MSRAPRPWLVRLTNLLVRYRGTALLVAVVTTILAFFPASRLQFEETIESLYARDDPRLSLWRESKKLFGGDEFVVLAYTDPNLFDPSGEKLTEGATNRIESLVEKLRTVPGLEEDTFQNLVVAMRAPIGKAAIRKMTEGILVGIDQQTTAILCRLEPVANSPIPRAEIYRRVREIADAHDPPAAVVGEPIQVHDMFRYVEEDGATLGMASSLLMMAVIFILFRSIRWMILPLLVVHVTIIWTKALLVISGIRMSMVSSMLNSIVTIIGIATVMHVTVRYRDHRLTKDPEEALRQTILELVVPIFWTIVTTAAAFAALTTSQVAPVANFGSMMALASLLVMFACATVLPAGILFGISNDIPNKAPGEELIARRLMQLTDWVERRRFTVSIGMTLIALVCAIGLSRLHVETDFSKNFHANTPIVKSLNLFETRLGGAGTWEVSFPAPDELGADFLSNVRDLAAELRDLEDPDSPGRITKVVSITDGLDVLKFLPLNWRITSLERMQPDFITGLYNADQGRMRLMLRARERQPSETKLKLIADVEAVARKRFPEARATGLFVLLTYLTESLMDDQFRCFLIALIAIMILMILAYRSVALGSILLIPNLFPIVLVLGTMGWIGLPINLATAMIASVSIGLTVDSSIHYVAGFAAARRHGLSFSAALRETHRGVGRALVFANIALVSGFSVLTLSHFIPLVYFGILAGAAMLGGLLGNLILLPLVLRIVDRNDDHQNAIKTAH